MNNNMNDHVVRVMTRGGTMTQDPLYPQGHPKRTEQDYQMVNNSSLVSNNEEKKEKPKFCIVLRNMKLVKNVLRILKMYLCLMPKLRIGKNMNLVRMIIIKMMIT